MFKFLHSIIPSKFHIALVISVIAVLLLLFYINKQHDEITIKADQIAALTDTVTIYKTKEGKNAAYSSVLKGTKKELLAILKKKDVKSYNTIKKTPGIQSFTNLKTLTRIDTITKVDTLIVTNNDHIPSTPDSIYITKRITNQYYDADIKVIQDSVAFKLLVMNEFKIITKTKSNGWFKPKSLVVDVINDNPYTVTTGLSSFEVTQPKRNIGLKVGVIAGIVAGILLLK